MAIASTPAPLDLASLPARAAQVIVSPARFFRDMPRTGGFIDPLVFMLAVGVVNGVIAGAGALLGLDASSVSSGAWALVLVPVMVAFGGFIAAGILFLLWKIMGSRQGYETAYRCIAHIYVITPIAALVGAVPGLAIVATLAALGWTLYLTVLASVEVHGIAAKTAWAVFGVLAAMLAISAVSVQLAANRLQSQLQGSYQQLQQLQELQQQLDRGD